MVKKYITGSHVYILLCWTNMKILIYCVYMKYEIGNRSFYITPVPVIDNIN